MAYNTRPAYQTRVAEKADYQALGLSGEWSEHVVTGVVVAVGVMVVALIAVLMGMA
jgi:hypothetical protein